jgi:hypothetical protein
VTIPVQILALTLSAMFLACAGMTLLLALR